MTSVPTNQHSRSSDPQLKLWLVSIFVIAVVLAGLGITGIDGAATVLMIDPNFAA